MSKNLVAWQGTAVLRRAQWDSRNGHTVQFGLPEPEAEDKSNPFRRFTKMRKGRVGTRFEAIIFDTAEEPAQVYNDGAMLKGWTDSNTGQTVSFWLANVEGGEHPMASYREGEAFAIALVELSEDDEPIDQSKRERAEDAAGQLDRTKKRGQLTSQGCALVCNNPEFWDYLSEVSGEPVKSALDAATTVRDIIGISSRRELDESEERAEEWHKIRRAFVAWQNVPA